jgi:hypothetical protein
VRQTHDLKGASSHTMAVTTAGISCLEGASARRWYQGMMLEQLERPLRASWEEQPQRFS